MIQLYLVICQPLFTFESCFATLYLSIQLGKYTLDTERLRKLRKTKGLSQRALAEELEIKQQQVSDYETGVATPTIENLTSIAKYFNVTTDYLLGLTDNPAGEITEDDLTPMERKLIFAVRSGALLEAIKSITNMDE